MEPCLDTSSNPAFNQPPIPLKRPPHRYSFLAQRVQVPNIQGFWVQQPYPQWYLGPKALKTLWVANSNESHPTAQAPVPLPVDVRRRFRGDAATSSRHLGSDTLTGPTWVQYTKYVPGKPVACNYGLLWLIRGLLWGIVAYSFGLLGVPGSVYQI